MAKAKTREKQRDITSFLEEDINLEQQYGKVERYVNNNKGKVIGILGFLLLAAALIFGFRNIYLPGQEASARTDMHEAEQYFMADDFEKALNGDGNNSGFLDIISDYSGMTKAVDLAHYYAGVCYLQQSDYQSAIDYLSKFGGNDEMVSSMALGATGDAHAELGDMAKAISFYKKAANNSDNEFTGVLFMKKAAGALELEGDYNAAKSLYEQIKKKFPESIEVANKSIDKLLKRAAALAGK